MKTILIVRDGWGYSENTEGNAVYLANTPNDDKYMRDYPWTLLKCTGNAVGIPEGTQGGSEPGHLTIGAGRIVWQPLEEINKSIRDGDFYMNPALLGAVENCREKDSSLHLMGLHSDQGIHGTTGHLYALLELARREGLKKVYIHTFLDGRDVQERSAKKFIAETINQTEEKGLGKIASIVGRFYAMDRDTNWQRIMKTYNLLVNGMGKEETTPIEALNHFYESTKLSDYYAEPIVIIKESGEPVATIQDGDSVIFWNFRSDRARQLTYVLTEKIFDEFPRKQLQIHFVCMSIYDRRLNLPVAFPQRYVENNLGKVLSNNGIKQLRIAETEKYAHVTFFFNSQREEAYPGEERILVPSLKVPSYEDKPEMSAPEITDRLIPEIDKNKYDFILVNYANGDLVGHSANLEASIKAVEMVDVCTGKVVDAGLKTGYTIMITGDHGNIETMFYPDGSPNPSHGLNLIPFILISNSPSFRHVDLKDGMGLSSITPTILEIMKIPKPPEMTAQSLIN